MFTAIARILRTIHIIPPAKVDPVRTRPLGKKGEATAARPTEATVTATPVNRDDTRKDVRKVEPAMVGIPRDADQRTPRVASPGLPPVDPVVAAQAARTSPPAQGANPRSPVTAPIGVEAPAESGPRPSATMTPGFDSGADVQDPTDINSCRDVAGHGGGNPSDDPWGSASAKGLLEGSLKDQVSPAENSRSDRSAPISFDKPVVYEHSAALSAKDGGFDDEAPEAGVERGACRMPDPSGEAPDQAIDSRAGDRLHRVEPPAKRSTRVPPRIADRPRIEEWTDDELLTLPEAAALFWPTGPITTNTLRTAGRDGTLAITKVAGKFFTTPMAIRRMGIDEVTVAEVAKGEEPDETSAATLFQKKLAEARRLGGGRARSKRAAKGSAAPAVSGRARQ